VLSEVNTSLLPYNTFGFDVQGYELIKIENKEQLEKLYAEDFFKSPFRVISGGSNLLLTQNIQEPILLVRIPGIEKIQETDEFVCIEFGAGENWHQCVLYCVDNEWHGIENMSLIPGCIGAAPIQNIGAYGTELKDVFESLKAFNIETGNIENFNLDQCQFGYRDSYFKQQGKGKYIITSVVLRLSKIAKINTQYGDIQNTLNQKNILNPTIKDVSNAVIEIRKSKLPDPAILGNSGSFFKNPVIEKSLAEKIQSNHPDLKIFPASESMVKIPAAWLIEKSGWKGHKRSHVGVHEKQALVLVHYGGGTGAEIQQLATEIQTDVANKFGVHLEFEVNIW
jgi:UDP-N-acetylmuramate dehydrogenase